MSKHAACSPACTTCWKSKPLTHVRYLCRYDAEGLAPRTYEKQRASYSPSLWLMYCYDGDFPRPEGAHTIPCGRAAASQFDQRADSCAQCIQLLTGGERPTVAAAKIYVLEGELTAEDMDKIRGYLINPWTPARLRWTNLLPSR